MLPQAFSSFPSHLYNLVDVLLITVQRSLVCFLVITGFDPDELCLSWSERASIWHFCMSAFYRLTNTAYYFVKSARKSLTQLHHGDLEPRLAVIHEAAFFEVQPRLPLSDSSIASGTTSPLCLQTNRRPSLLNQTLINVLNRDSDLKLFDHSFLYNRDPTLEDVDCALLDETDFSLELALLSNLNEDELSDSDSNDKATASYNSDSDACTSSSELFFYNVTTV